MSAYKKPALAYAAIESARELLKELESPVRDHNMIRIRQIQLKERIKEFDEAS